jgi:hypothetical protein
MAGDQRRGGEGVYDAGKSSDRLYNLAILSHLEAINLELQ